MLEHDQIHTLKEIVIKSGKLLLTFYQQKITKTYKGDGSFSTEADIESELFLKKELHNLLPHAGFYAEESGIENGENDYIWVIDPLDGTTNFAHNIPYFCVSVALTYKHAPMISCIYNPITQELFYAQKGAGAFCNDLPIHISEEKDFRSSITSVGFLESDFSFLSILWYKCSSMRINGASALDLAQCAAGRYDSVVLTQFAWWDVAAGILLIEEAGGKIIDFEGNPASKGQKSMICGNRFLVDYAFKLINNVNSI